MDKSEYFFEGIDVDEIVKDTFSKRLRDIRTKAKLSQAQFADMLGISVAALSYYERGERIPDIVFLYKVQICFNIPDGYLLGNTDTLNKSYIDISDKLCLSDAAIDKIIKYADENDYYFNGDTFNTLSGLLEDDEFYSVINLLTWSNIDSQLRYPDEEYIKYIAAKKFISLIESIQERGYCIPKIGPISQSQIIQKDYIDWLIEKLDNKTMELEKIYKNMTKEIKNKKSANYETYKQTERYKALCNIKEASDDGQHNTKKE